jgi:tRNA uridine 5-carbamoylmethylation protein Kti12
MTDTERELLLEVADYIYQTADGDDYRANFIRDLSWKVKRETAAREQEERRLDNLINEVDPLGQW